MERNLFERDRTGLHDFLLLENYESETEFIDNLKKRFQENLIYTYIGQVLISVNPYKELDIYNEEDVKAYKSRHFFDTPPHIFALSQNAFRSLIDENKGQCVLISGESGSGKTEASKKVLEFIAAASDHTVTVEQVKDKLLQSNPLMEAFGNAKTIKNNNSSRFGKYMDVQFEFTGVPKGGHIINYLLEKSRVIFQSPGERNFHIFYQLIKGAEDLLLDCLALKRNCSNYRYLTNGDNATTSEINDVASFQSIKRAMAVIELSTAEQNDVFEILAGILHLGNVDFIEVDGTSNIKNPELVQAIAKVLHCDADQLTIALTHRTISARGDVVTSPLNQELSIFARDALSKAMYDRLFSWLVRRVNQSLHSGHFQIRDKMIGILDIYGFEIFEKNSFEQFCINFCNEKMQQLFIELTLKSEQDEYRNEGIQWEKIEYFDNKVICSLIEEPHRGIIALLDEECLLPGDPTDLTFLAKLNSQLGEHPHYICHRTASTAVQKTMGRDDFRLVHYAGDVTYGSKGFLEKNNDLLFRDLKEAMLTTTNKIIINCFPQDELKRKKRPETVVTQFRTSLLNLIEILMVKEPSYIRCIKPNTHQTAGQFEDDLVSHQVKYLGLMENLRVRRAGFAYRRTYDTFLQRYKSLGKTTWPNYNGLTKDGVQVLVNDLHYGQDDYRMGKTKIFIRFPKTLFDTEDAFQKKKHEIAAIIQSRWKGRQQRAQYLKLRAAAVVFQKNIRRHLAIAAAKRRKDAVIKIRAFIKGFITRNDPPNGVNEAFIENSRRIWLTRLSKNLPKNLLDSSWIVAPTHCSESSTLLYRIYRHHMAKMFRTNLSAERKRQFKLKVLAEKKFKGKKQNYADSVANWFVKSRVPEVHSTAINTFVNATLQNETLVYSTICTKFDRHGYKPRERFILLTNKAFYVLDGKSYKQKHRLQWDAIDFCVTSKNDNLILVRIPISLKKDKGDLILQIPELIEFCTWIIDATKNPQIIAIVETESLHHTYVTGTYGTIDLVQGPTPYISKGKDGHLLVVVGQ